jgi:hypothetical protein
LDLWCKCSKPFAPLNCLTVIYSIHSTQPLVNPSFEQKNKKI